jgi:mRNA interferase HigB
MKIISFKVLREFYEREPKSETAIREWYKKAEKANWNNFSDIKKTFNSVDGVGNMRYVFDIKGNDYRIVAKVFFKIKSIYIRFVGTHKEYDRITDIDKI